MSKFYKTIDQTYFIKYHTEYKREFSSEKAALLFERLEYWSQKYSKGFWKFFELCEHHHRYRQGDSWEEELGFSRKAFNRVYSLIGTHYKSKSAFDAQQDPFQGKLYASYYNRKTNLTHYFRNHDKVNRFLKNLWSSTKKLVQKTTSTADNIFPQKGSSRNGHLGSSLTRARSDILQRTTSSTASAAKTPQAPPLELSPACISAEQEEKNKIIALEMTQQWNIITHNQHVLRSSDIPKLLETFSQHFEGNMELWKGYCSRIATSKFLMGEASNTKFKALLNWVVKPDVIQRIMTGIYSLGDRTVETQQAPQAAQIARLNHEIEQLNRCLEDLKDDTKKRYNQRLKDQVHALTLEQKQHLRTLFEQQQAQGHDGFAGDFQQRGWKALGAEIMFDLFLEDHLRRQHQWPEREIAVEQALAQSGLREKRAQLIQERDTLRHTQHLGQTLFTIFSKKFQDFVYG